MSDTIFTTSGTSPTHTTFQGSRLLGPIPEIPPPPANFDDLSEREQTRNFIDRWMSSRIRPTLNQGNTIGFDPQHQPRPRPVERLNPPQLPTPEMLLARDRLHTLWIKKWSVRPRRHRPLLGTGLVTGSGRTNKWVNDDSFVVRLIRKGATPKQDLPWKHTGWNDDENQAYSVLDYGEPRNYERIIDGVVFDVVQHGTRTSPLEESTEHGDWRGYENDWRTQAEREHLLRNTKLKVVVRNRFKLSKRDSESATHNRYYKASDFTNDESISEGPRLLKGVIATSLKDLQEQSKKKDYADWNGRLLALGMPEILKGQTFAPPETTQSKDLEEDCVVEEWKEKMEMGVVSIGRALTMGDQPPHFYIEGPLHVVESFRKSVAYLASLQTGITREQAIEQAGLKISADALRKAAKRERTSKVNWDKVPAGWHFTVVVLNGKPELKLLAASDATHQAISDIWHTKRLKTTQAAHKKEKGKGSKHTLPERLRVATARVHDAFARSYVWQASMEGVTNTQREEWATMVDTPREEPPNE